MRIFILLCMLFFFGCSEPNAHYDIWKGANGIQIIELDLGETLTQVRITNEEEKQQLIKKVNQLISVIDQFYDQLHLQEGVVPDSGYAYKISREGKKPNSAFLVNLVVTFKIRNRQEADYLRPYLVNLKQDLEKVSFNEW